MTRLFRCWSTLVLILALGLSAMAQPRRLGGSPALKQQLEQLRVVGRVLLIAAHPDDENTALLAYCAQGRHYKTAYLSLTRGEGGQNLIGNEIGDLLGVIRTQELLAARRYDGAEQFFSRAIDFGFSKTADETIAKWGRQEVLGDIVWIIRRFRPDVVIASDVSSPPETEWTSNFFGLAARSLDLVIEQRQRQSLAAASIVLRPELKDMDFLDYGGRLEDALRLGG